MDNAPQFKVDENGQLHQAVFTPVNEADLQAQAEAAHQEYQRLSDEVDQAEQSLQNAQAALDAVKADLEAKVQAKASAEDAHLKSQAVLTAIAIARELAASQPQPDENQGDSADAGNGQANGEIPVHAPEAEPAAA